MTTQQHTASAAARTGQIRTARSAATLSLLIALITIRAGAQTYNAAAQFSGTDNPNGVWSYGCTQSLGAAFSLYTQQIGSSGLYNWGTASLCGPSSPPGLLYNPTNADVTPVPPGTLTIPAHTILSHPGPEDQNSVLRFTAPASGNYQVQAVFWGDSFTVPTTTDVHVLHNGLGLYTSEVYGYGRPSSDKSFTTTVSLAAGDTIDFAVGYGTDGNYYYDSTGVSAVITRLGLSCQLTGTVNGPPKQIMITMQAVPPGLNTIQLTSSTNATVDVPSFVTGTTSPVIVTATKINQSESSEVAFTISSISGATASCDPVDYTATIENGPETHAFRKLSSAEHYIRIVNGTPGLSRVTFIVNGRRLPEVTFKADGAPIVDIGSAMYEGSNDNLVVMEAIGRRGASAFVLIGDASVE